MGIAKKYHIDNIGDYLTTGGGIAFAQIISLVSLPFVAKLSGTEVFGAYSYYFALISISCVFCTLKLEYSVFNVNASRLNLLESTFIRYLIISSAVVGTLFYLFNFNAEIEHINTSLSIAFAIVCISRFEFHIQSNIRLGFFRRNALARIARALAFPVLFYIGSLIIVVSSQLIIIAFAAANLISDQFFLCTDANMKSFLGGPLRKGLLQLWPDVKRTVVYLTPAHFLNKYTSGAVILISGYFYSDDVSQVGMFALALKFIIGPVAIITIATSDVIKREVLVDAHSALNNFKRTAGLFLLIGVVVASIVFFFGEIIAIKILGNEWAMVGQFAVALLPYFLTVLVLSPLTCAYLVLGRQDIDFYWQFFNSVIITISIFIGLQYSFLTAVYAYSFTASISLIISFCICYFLINGRDLTYVN